MSELDEAIGESIERANESRLNSKIAIYIEKIALYEKEKTALSLFLK